MVRQFNASSRWQPFGKFHLCRPTSSTPRMLPRITVYKIEAPFHYPSLSLCLSPSFTSKLFEKSYFLPAFGITPSR